MAASESEKGEDRYRRGMEKRAEMYGSRSLPGGRGTPDLAPYLPRWVMENVWGDLWCRPALGDKTRLLVTIVALAVSKEHSQLRRYLRVAPRVGWTREELAEVLVHLAPYVGVPTAQNCLELLAEVLPAEGA